MSPTWDRLRRAVVTVTLGVVAGGLLLTSPALAAPVAAPTAATTTATLDLVARKAMAATEGTVTYLWGGGHGAKPPTSPDRTDCSGFSRWAYSTALGYDIGGGSSESMRTSGRFTLVTAIPQPGDVVFFASGGRPPATHMGVYVGTDLNGNRRMAHNSGSGSIAGIRAINGYYSDRVIGYYRLTAIPVRISTQQTAIAATLSPAVAAKGEQSAVTGRFRSANGAIKGASVYLDVRNPDGSWRTAKRAVTSATGDFRFTVTGTGSTRTFQVHYAGSWRPWLASRSQPLTQHAPSR